MRGSDDMPRIEDGTTYAQIRLFKWGDTIVCQQCIDRKKERLEAAPGSSLVNPRLQTGAAATSSSLYVRARGFMRITSAMQRKDAPAHAATLAPSSAPASLKPLVTIQRRSSAARPAVLSLLVLQKSIWQLIYTVSTTWTRLLICTSWIGTGYDVSSNTQEPV